MPHSASPLVSLRKNRVSSAGGERLALTLLVTLVAGSVLALGAVHLPILALLCGVAVAALVIVARGRGELEWPLPALLLVALGAWSAAQALPMPVAWLAKLAPANADVWGRALLPFGDHVRWASVSLDPGASLVEATKWTLYGATFALAAAVSSKRGASVGVLVVFASSVLAAVVTLAHGLLGATKVYGLYEPHFRVLPWHVGPLLNANNLAGYLNLGIFCGIAIALMREPLVRPWLSALGVAALVGVEITAASRAGVLALPIGVFVLVALVGSSRSRTRIARRAASGSTWLVTVALVGGLVLAIAGGSREVWQELLDKNLDKMQMARWVVPLVRQHAWLGIGRGAFESVFPAYRPVPGNVVYTHAENFVVQWISEWGLPVAVVALVGLAILLRPSRLGARRSAMAAGAVAAAAVLLLQNLADLGLEIPALCIALCVVLGSLWGDAGRTGEGAERNARTGRPWSASIALIGLVALAGALSFGRRDVASDRELVRAAYEAIDWRVTPPKLDGLRAELRDAMRRHPAEPYFSTVGALLAFRAHDQPVMPWLQRALEREPLNGRTHLLLAQVLRASGATRQALFELRLAAESDHALVPNAGVYAAAWSASFDELLLAAPDGMLGAVWLDELARRLVRPEDRPRRVACDEEALRRNPSLVGPHERKARELVELVGSAEHPGRCADRAACEAEIEAHARKIEAAEPRSSAAARLRADLLLAEGRPADADALLAKACELVEDRAECYRARVMAASRTEGSDRMNAAVQQYVGAACTTMPACADAETWIGNVLGSRGEPNAALTHLTRAAGMDPSDARWLLVADAATSVGSHAQAVQALQRVLERRGGHDPDISKRIDEERAQALGTIGIP